MSVELNMTLKRVLKIDGKEWQPGPFDVFDPANPTHMRLLTEGDIVAELVEPESKKRVTRRSTKK